jgi:hypothetical protein
MQQTRQWWQNFKVLVVEAHLAPCEISNMSNLKTCYPSAKLIAAFCLVIQILKESSVVPTEPKLICASLALDISL